MFVSWHYSSKTVFQTWSRATAITIWFIWPIKLRASVLFSSSLLSFPLLLDRQAFPLTSVNVLTAIATITTSSRALLFQSVMLKCKRTTWEPNKRATMYYVSSWNEFLALQATNQMWNYAKTSIIKWIILNMGRWWYQWNMCKNNLLHAIVMHNRAKRQCI